MKTITSSTFKLTFFMLFLMLWSCQSVFQKDVSQTAPVAFYNADDLIIDLKHFEKTNIEKVIAVRGRIVEKNTKNGKFTILMKGKTNHNNYVICEMNDPRKDTYFDLVEGDTVIVKGVLKGLLNDVVLLNCVVDNTLPYE